MFMFYAYIAATQAAEIEPLKTQTIQVGLKTIEVEVADELHERRLGLMHRTSMDINHGMLFVYEQAETRSFWMKNTHIPLSIAYISSECTIVHIADMTPLSTKGVPSVHPAQFALEMNQGWFQANGVKVGDSLKGVGHCVSK